MSTGASSSLLWSIGTCFVPAIASPMEHDMIDINDHTTIGEALEAAIAKYASLSLLAVPANPGRNYLPEGREFSYAEAGRLIDALKACYQSAGYGVGHRIGLLLESRPEHMLHKLAMNSLGICCVPISCLSLSKSFLSSMTNLPFNPTPSGRRFL